MPDQYDNTNRGAVWPKRADAKPGAPDFKIEFNFQGTDYALAIWRRKETDNPNGPSYRFSIENKSGASTQQQAAPADMNVPF